MSDAVANVSGGAEIMRKLITDEYKDDAGRQPVTMRVATLLRLLHKSWGIGYVYALIEDEPVERPYDGIEPHGMGDEEQIRAWFLGALTDLDDELAIDDNGFAQLTSD